MGESPGGHAQRAPAHDPGGPALSSPVGCRADRQYRVDRRPWGDTRQFSLCGCETRRHWPNAQLGVRPWPGRHYRQLHLPRPDQHRDHGPLSRRSEDHLREAPHRPQTYGEPEEVAHITLSLVLPAASYITGTAIPVDGGLTIRNA